MGQTSGLTECSDGAVSLVEEALYTVHPGPRVSEVS